MRRVAGLVTMLLLVSWLTMPLPTLGAIKVAVIEIKGMVCNA
jgi:hypothetical protein